MDKNQEPLYTKITKRENTQNITTQEKNYNRSGSSNCICWCNYVSKEKKGWTGNKR